MRARLLFLLAMAFATEHGPLAAQSLTGTLIGVVKDAQQQVVKGRRRSRYVARARPRSSQATNETGQPRFPPLDSGEYVLDIQALGLRLTTA